MRPNLLNPLFASIATLPGVGPKVEKLYQRLFGRNDEPPRIVDLLFHLPTGTIDRRARPKLRDVVPGTLVTVEVTVDRHRPPARLSLAVIPSGPAYRGLARNPSVFPAEST